jgi:hypothetical protein
MTVEIIAPIAGLVGVMIGAAATQLGAMAASRRTWNTEEIRARRTFHVEVIGVAHEQLILFTNIAERLKGRVLDVRKQLADGSSLSDVDMGYLHDEDHLTRLRAATDQWRSTFTRSVVFAGPAMHSVLAELDDHRAHVTEALNSLSLDRVQPSIEDFEGTLEKFYKEVQRSTIESNLVLNESFLMWPWNIRARRELTKELRNFEVTQATAKLNTGSDN